MDLLPEYSQTIFIAKLPEAGWPERFVIITACNPRSGGDRGSDAKAHAALRKTLSRLGCWKHRVDGASPDWQHREIGFAAAGLDLEKALELGRQFEQNAIFVVEANQLRVVGCFGGAQSDLGLFSQRLYEPADKPAYSVYVVLLDDAVLKVKRFREANPRHKPGSRCYYVGMTGLSPEERFANHKKGYKDCTLVRDHGLELAHEKYDSIPKLSQKAAVAKEVELAAGLRSQGFAAWQH